MLIAIEGLDGVGKTTISKMLVDRVNKEQPNRFCKAFYTRAPGGSEIGEKIREMMLENGPEGDPYVQMHLALAARRAQLSPLHEHFYHRYSLIVSDRLDWSTIVYQTASGADPDHVKDTISRIPVGHGHPLMHFRIVAEPILLGKTSSFDRASSAYKQKLHRVAQPISSIRYNRRHGLPVDTPVHVVQNKPNQQEKAVDRIIQHLANI